MTRPLSTTLAELTAEVRAELDHVRDSADRASDDEPVRDGYETRLRSLDAAAGAVHRQNADAGDASRRGRAPR